MDKERGGATARAPKSCVAPAVSPAFLEICVVTLLFCIFLLMPTRSFMWTNRPVSSIVLFASTPLNLFAFFLTDLPVLSTIGAVSIVYAGLYYYSSRSLESRGRMII